jgi:imidazolonepropionase-like amidohydrolase
MHRRHDGRSRLASARAGLIAAAVALSVVTSPDSLAAQERVFAITGATLIDGTGSPARGSMTIVMEGGRITAVEPDRAASIPEGAVTVDLGGRSVIPGLIDAHVHLVMTPGAPVWRERAERILGGLLRGGVTNVRDMAGDARLIGELADAVETGEMRGPNVDFTALVAGPGFFEDPRVRAASAGFEPGDAPWARAVDADTDIAAVVDDAVATGATGLKAYALVEPELLRRIAAVAHGRGLRVWAHATVFPSRPSDAVSAGVDVLSHATYLVWEASPPTTEYTRRATGNFIADAPTAPAVREVLREMAARGTMLDATTALVNAIIDRDDLGPARASWTIDVVRLAHEEGVDIVAGTDLPYNGEGLPPLHEELRVLVEEAGLSPMDAIVAATRNGARAIGIEEDHGTIEPGKIANLVVLDADPLEDIRNTETIRSVIQSGIVVERDR